MKVIAFLGSPRVDGNSELLLKEALKAVEEGGHELTLFRPGEMNIAPCTNCGGCDETGECVIEDEMADVYGAIREGERFVISSPIFFFGLPAQIMALIDRCQSLWCEKYLLRKAISQGPNGRKGLLMLVGGMKKEIGYTCGNATVTAFYRSISVPEHEVISYPLIDAKGAIRKHETALEDAYKAGKKLVSKR